MYVNKAKLKNLKEKYKLLKLFVLDHLKNGWNFDVFTIHTFKKLLLFLFIVVNWRQSASLVISGSWKSEHNWELNCWHVPFCMQTFQFGDNVWRITRIRAISRIRNQYTKNQIWTSYFKYIKIISSVLGINCFLNFVHCLIFKENLIFGPVIENGSICAMQLSSIAHTNIYLRNGWCSVSETACFFKYEMMGRVQKAKIMSRIFLRD
jgi:hypothetical protein